MISDPGYGIHGGTHPVICNNLVSGDIDFRVQGADMVGLESLSLV